MNPKTLKIVHALVAVGFAVVWVFAGIFGWLTSVAFLSHISMATAVYAALAAWEGARAEEKSDKD
jgi:hypothetical protein